MKPVFLAGVKHCGKTTLGKLLAEILGVEFIDIDDVIAAQTGLTPRQVFLQKGEDAFKAAELSACAAVCARLSAEDDKTAVVALGGGICDNGSAVECVRKTGAVIYLDVPEKTLLRRILKKAERAPGGAMNNLPAYIARGNPRSKDDAAAIFHSVFARRSEQYALIADAVFAPRVDPAGGFSAAENARRLARAVRSHSFLPAQ